MLIRILSAYICSENKVVVICIGDSYVFPYRLGKEKNEKLLKAVLEAGRIETERWEVI